MIANRPDVSQEPHSPAPAVARGAAAISQLLAELTTLLESLSQANYLQKPVGTIQASIASHVRHCLDHIAALLAAAETGDLNYDVRVRNTPVETDRHAALSKISTLQYQLTALGQKAADRPLSISCLLTADGEPVHAITSLGREFAFVLSHTIHHNALIRVMASTLGVTVPERFGFAPSTPADKN